MWVRCSGAEMHATQVAKARQIRQRVADRQCSKTGKALGVDKEWQVLQVGRLSGKAGYVDRQGKHVRHITQWKARSLTWSYMGSLPPTHQSNTTEGTPIPSLHTPYARTLAKLKTCDTLFPFSSNIQSNITHLDQSSMWMTCINEGNFLHLVKSNILMKTTLWYDTV
jgi:hypothetical protein